MEWGCLPGSVQLQAVLGNLGRACHVCLPQTGRQRHTQQTPVICMGTCLGRSVWDTGMAHSYMFGPTSWLKNRWVVVFMAENGVVPCAHSLQNTAKWGENSKGGIKAKCTNASTMCKVGMHTYKMQQRQNVPPQNVFLFVLSFC